MSLDIYTSQCKGQDPKLNHSVAMAMFATGTSTLKDQHEADEFFIRYRMMTIAMNLLPTDRILTYAEISSFIGATTNVSRKTATQWNKQVAGVLRDSAFTILRRHRAQMERESNATPTN